MKKNLSSSKRQKLAFALSLILASSSITPNIILANSIKTENKTTSSSKATNTKTTNAKATNNKATNTKTTNTKATNTKTTDTKATNTKATNAKTTNAKTTDTKAITDNIYDPNPSAEKILERLNRDSTFKDPKTKVQVNTTDVNGFKKSHITGDEFIGSSDGFNPAEFNPYLHIATSTTTTDKSNVNLTTYNTSALDNRRTSSIAGNIIADHKFGITINEKLRLNVDKDDPPNPTNKPVNLPIKNNAGKYAYQNFNIASATLIASDVVGKYNVFTANVYSFHHSLTNISDYVANHSKWLENSNFGGHNKYNPQGVSSNKESRPESNSGTSNNKLTYLFLPRYYTMRTYSDMKGIAELNKINEKVFQHMSLNKNAVIEFEGVEKIAPRAFDNLPNNGSSIKVINTNMLESGYVGSKAFYNINKQIPENDYPDELIIKVAPMERQTIQYGGTGDTGGLFFAGARAKSKIRIDAPGNVLFDGTGLFKDVVTETLEINLGSKQDLSSKHYDGLNVTSDSASFKNLTLGIYSRIRENTYSNIKIIPKDLTLNIKYKPSGLHVNNANFEHLLNIAKQNASNPPFKGLSITGNLNINGTVVPSYALDGITLSPTSKIIINTESSEPAAFHNFKFPTNPTEITLSKAIGNNSFEEASINHNVNLNIGNIKEIGKYAFRTSKVHEKNNTFNFDNCIYIGNEAFENFEPIDKSKPLDLTFNFPKNPSILADNSYATDEDLSTPEFLHYAANNIFANLKTFGGNLTVDFSAFNRIGTGIFQNVSTELVKTQNIIEYGDFTVKLPNLTDYINRGEHTSIPLSQNVESRIPNGTFLNVLAKNVNITAPTVKVLGSTSFQNLTAKENFLLNAPKVTAIQDSVFDSLNAKGGLDFNFSEATTSGQNAFKNVTSETGNININMPALTSLGIDSFDNLTSKNGSININLSALKSLPENIFGNINAPNGNVTLKLSSLSDLPANSFGTINTNNLEIHFSDAASGFNAFLNSPIPDNYFNNINNSVKGNIKIIANDISTIKNLWKFVPKFKDKLKIVTTHGSQNAIDATKGPIDSKHIWTDTNGFVFSKLNLKNPTEELSAKSEATVSLIGFNSVDNPIISVANTNIRATSNFLNEPFDYTTKLQGKTLNFDTVTYNAIDPKNSQNVIPITAKITSISPENTGNLFSRNLDLNKANLAFPNFTGISNGYFENLKASEELSLTFGGNLKKSNKDNPTKSAFSISQSVFSNIDIPKLILNLSNIEKLSIDNNAFNFATVNTIDINLNNCTIEDVSKIGTKTGFAIPKSTTINFYVDKENYDTYKALEQRFDKLDQNKKDTIPNVNVYFGAPLPDINVEENNNIDFVTEEGLAFKIEQNQNVTGNTANDNLITFMGYVKNIDRRKIYANLTDDSRVNIETNNVTNPETSNVTQVKTISLLNLNQILYGGYEALASRSVTKDPIKFNVTKIATNNTNGNLSNSDFSPNSTISFPHVLSLDNNLFKDFTNLAEINFNGVVNIGNAAFKGVQNLKTINLSNSLTSIGDEAFANITKHSDVVNIEINFKNAKLPLSSIGENIFSGINSNTLLITDNITTLRSLMKKIGAEKQFVKAKPFETRKPDYALDENSKILDNFGFSYTNLTTVNNQPTISLVGHSLDSYIENINERNKNIGSHVYAQNISDLANKIYNFNEIKYYPSDTSTELLTANITNVTLDSVHNPISIFGKYNFEDNSIIQFNNALNLGNNVFSGLNNIPTPAKNLTVQLNNIPNLTTNGIFKNSKNITIDVANNAKTQSEDFNLSLNMFKDAENISLKTKSSLVLEKARNINKEIANTPAPTPPEDGQKPLPAQQQLNLISAIQFENVEKKWADTNHFVYKSTDENNVSLIGHKAFLPNDFKFEGYYATSTISSNKDGTLSNNSTTKSVSKSVESSAINNVIFETATPKTLKITELGDGVNKILDDSQLTVNNINALSFNNVKKINTNAFNSNVIELVSLGEDNKSTPPTKPDTENQTKNNTNSNSETTTPVNSLTSLTINTNAFNTPKLTGINVNGSFSTPLDLNLANDAFINMSGKNLLINLNNSYLDKANSQKFNMQAFPQNTTIRTSNATTYINLLEKFFESNNNPRQYVLSLAYPRLTSENQDTLFAIPQGLGFTKITSIPKDTVNSGDISTPIEEFQGDVTKSNHKPKLIQGGDIAITKSYKNLDSLENPYGALTTISANENYIIRSGNSQLDLSQKIKSINISDVVYGENITPNSRGVYFKDTQLNPFSFKVKKIGEDVFASTISGSNTINSLFENGASVKMSNVNDVGNRAFKNATGLTTVILGDDITVGEYAFYGTTNLETLKSDTTKNNLENIKAMGEYAFAKSGIKNVTTNPQLFDIPNGAFSDSDLLSINSNNQEGVANLKNFTTIGANAFANTKLKTITLNPDLKSLSNGVFKNISTLTDINLENVAYIGDSSLANTPSLKSVSLNKVKEIGKNAFANSGVKSIKLTLNTTDIGIGAFSGTDNLKIYLDESITESSEIIRPDIFAKNGSYVDASLATVYVKNPDLYSKLNANQEFKKLDVKIVFDGNRNPNIDIDNSKEGNDIVFDIEPGEGYVETKPLQKTIIKLPEIDPNYLIKNSVNFSDVGNNHWAKAAVDRLTMLKIVSGYPDGTFRPNNSIKRADAVIMFVKLLGLTPPGTTNFEDVLSTKYYAEPISIARLYSLITGKKNLFYPEEYITREDTIIIVSNILKILKIKLNDDENTLTKFKDFKYITKSSLKDVAIVVNSGLIRGVNNGIYPLKNITRAEMSFIISNLYDIIKKALAMDPKDEVEYTTETTTEETTETTTENLDDASDSENNSSKNDDISSEDNSSSKSNNDSKNNNNSNSKNNNNSKNNKKNNKK